MPELNDFFLKNARLSRRALAQFLGETRAALDDVADELDLGDRLTIEEAIEVAVALEDDADDADDADDEEE